MIIIPNKEVYQCEHCRCKKISKGAMTRHEKVCHMNPANKDACLSCKFMIVGEKTVEAELDYYGNQTRDYSKKCKSFTCQKLNKELYPFAAEKKNLPERYPETFAGLERMPTVCALFQHEYL